MLTNVCFFFFKIFFCLLEYNKKMNFPLKGQKLSHASRDIFVVLYSFVFVISKVIGGILLFLHWIIKFLFEKATSA